MISVDIRGHLNHYLKKNYNNNLIPKMDEAQTNFVLSEFQEKGVVT